MNEKFFQCSFGLVVITCISLAGCGGGQTTASNPPTDRHGHDHDDGHVHHESFSEAVGEVESLNAAVKTAFADSDLSTADGPLHEIGHLLEELPELAAQESLSEEDNRQVKQSVDSLMDSFGALDERIHGGAEDGKSYDDVASEIDAALSNLKTIVAREPAE